MQKYMAFLIVVFMIVFLWLADALAQSSGLRGKVRWITGAPAVGVEVKIMQNERMVAITYTNDRGLYAFFNIKKPFHLTG